MLVVRPSSSSVVQLELEPVVDVDAVPGDCVLIGSMASRSTKYLLYELLSCT